MTKLLSIFLHILVKMNLCSKLPRFAIFRHFFIIKICKNLKFQGHEGFIILTYAYTHLLMHMYDKERKERVQSMRRKRLNIGQFENSLWSNIAARDTLYCTVRTKRGERKSCKACATLLLLHSTECNSFARKGKKGLQATKHAQKHIKSKLRRYIPLNRDVFASKKFHICPKCC